MIVNDWNFADKEVKSSPTAKDTKYVDEKSE
jgi:hypothetical protein